MLQALWPTEQERLSLGRQRDRRVPGLGGNGSELLQKGLVKGSRPVTRCEQTALRAGSKAALAGDRALLRWGRKRDCGDPRDGAQRLPAPG